MMSESSDDDEGEMIYTTGTAIQPSNHRIFTVNFFGSSIATIVTSNTSIIRKWIYDTLLFNRNVRRQRPLVVGLGVQWDPDDDNPADTLQLCVENRCLIIQLSRVVTFVPRILRRFLADETIRFVGIRNYTDEGRLSRCEHGLSVGKILNLGSYTGGCHVNSSMATMASDILGLDGVTKDPEIGRSEWGRNLLSKEQVEYACVDALVSYKIGMKLKMWNY